MVLPRPTRITVEIVFDFVCPWCYLGVHRFARMRARRYDLAIQPIWRPFLLNPDMPRMGVSRTDYAARKFGDEERARRFYATITEIATTEGLAVDFGRIRRTPSSVDAHRLVRFAATAGRAQDVVLAIFQAYFQDGTDIGSADSLVRIAAGVGLEADLVRQFLLSDLNVDQIHADNLYAHRLGINGVPCFVVDGTAAIAGAQEPDVLERLIELAACDAAP
ncbi:MAG: DsbA family oxidoreductase [Acidiphilium sp.]|nr:DsbA family oxidoreductase [Acidiphilium sp.]MDD4935801.1 DsbA family oxidoreductase [Acidiphilium sp.]